MVFVLDELRAPQHNVKNSDMRCKDVDAEEMNCDTVTSTARDRTHESLAAHDRHLEFSLLMKK